MQTCPTCGSVRLHQSHPRGVVERLRGRFSGCVALRCWSCGWRGWVKAPFVLCADPTFDPASAQHAEHLRHSQTVEAMLRSRLLADQVKAAASIFHPPQPAGHTPAAGSNARPPQRSQPPPKTRSPGP